MLKNMNEILIKQLAYTCSLIMSFDAVNRRTVIIDKCRCEAVPSNHPSQDVVHFKSNLSFLAYKHQLPRPTQLSV